MEHARKVILLDLGGVVEEATGRTALSTLLPHLSEEQILARWHESKAAGDFERGRISKETFASAFVTVVDGIRPGAALACVSTEVEPGQA